MKIITTLALASSALLFASQSLAESTQNCPERDLVAAGTFEAVVKTAGVIVGARWGEGTITLNDGTVHKISLSGAKVLEIGASEKQLGGTVYNLAKLEDFPGVFSGVGGGLAVGTKGLGGVSMTNGKCVVINASPKKSTGLKVSMPIAPGGVKISIVE